MNEDDSMLGYVYFLFFNQAPFSALRIGNATILEQEPPSDHDDLEAFYDEINVFFVAMDVDFSA